MGVLTTVFTLLQQHQVMGETVSQTVRTMKAQGANQDPYLFFASLQYEQQTQLPEIELLHLAHQEGKFHKMTDRWKNYTQYEITICASYETLCHSIHNGW